MIFFLFVCRPSALETDMFILVGMSVFCVKIRIFELVFLV